MLHAIGTRHVSHSYLLPMAVPQVRLHGRLEQGSAR